MLKWISAIFIFGLSLSASAEIYKWKGTGGKIHFSDRNPDQTAEQVILKPDLSEEKVDQARQKSKEFVGRQQRKAVFQKEEAGRKNRELQNKSAQQAKKDRYCVGARKELRVLKMGVPVYRTDKTGSRSYLGDDQRESEMNEWKRNIRKYCG